MFGIHDLITREVAFSQAIWGYLVRAIYHFNVDIATGQWTVNEFDVTITGKGNSILYSLLTIMHYGLDFLAQLTMLLPGVTSNVYNTMQGASMQVLP